MIDLLTYLLAELTPFSMNFSVRTKSHLRAKQYFNLLKNSISDFIPFIVTFNVLEVPIIALTPAAVGITI